MATSLSPQLSPIIGNSHRIDRRHNSNSPPLPEQQLSKRDKRRAGMANTLKQKTNDFSENRDMHYRNYLGALQVDSALISEADVSGERPLPDSAEEVERLVTDSINRHMKSAGNNINLRTGRIYADFAKDVNDAMEDRDATLATHRRDFDVKLADIEAVFMYRQKLASAEYKALRNTLRDRLVNSVTSKKNRLSKDKESLELGENSNAFLLHPSQFGIANPSSPGGIHGKRATRHRRDVDDLPNFTEGNKRKRKAHDSDESPAPTRQRTDNGSSTPLWNVNLELNVTKATQIDSSLYSVDKLFTEKELAMTYNTAALTAHAKMVRHRFPGDVETPPNGKSESSSETEKAGGTADQETEDVDSLGGVMMERQYSHATRSTRGAGNFSTGYGIDAVGDLNYPGSFEAITKQIPKLPPVGVYTRTYTTKDPAIFGPASLTADDAAAEYEMIRRARLFNEEKGNGMNLDSTVEDGGRTLLEEASTVKKYTHWVQSSSREKLAQGRAFLKADQAVVESSLRGEPMARQESNASSMGGTSMSRQGTRM